MPVVADEIRVPFSTTRTGLARIHPRFGIQEVTVRRCQKDGDLFLTLRSGERLIAFSLTFDEFNELGVLADKIEGNDAGDSIDT